MFLQEIVYLAQIQSYLYQNSVFIFRLYVFRRDTAPLAEGALEYVY